MSIRLSPTEAWDVVAASHTGIFTSLRSDGVPMSLPVWFVALDGFIFVTTPERAEKVARLRRDPRCSFLVESGTRWTDLRAVHLTGVAHVLDEADPHCEVARRAFAEKYEQYRTPRRDMPTPTARHYAAANVVIRMTPDERILSWDNARLRPEARPTKEHTA